MISIKQSIVIDKHPLCEVRFRSALHFHMNQDPGFSTFLRKYFDQLVGVSTSQLSVAHDLLQFVVQKFKPPRPVNFTMDRRKQ